MDTMRGAGWSGGRSPVARLLAALAVAAGAASLAACGSGSPADPVVAAATKSEQAGGVHVATMVTVSFPNGGRGVISGEGSFDDQKGELTVDLSNLLQNSPLPIGSGSGVEARYLTEAGDPVLYLRMPFLSSQLPPGKTWVRLDLQRAGNAMGLNFNELLGQAGQNPAQVLDLLQASGEVKKVGPDIVGGKRVTQYHGVIDLQKALEIRGVSDAAIERLLAGGAAATVPVDVWIGDDDGLVHQVRTTSTTNISGQTVTTMSLTTMSRWGTPVSVEAPPSGEVYDVSGAATTGPAA
jgi:hypothetical protein